MLLLLLLMMLPLRLERGMQFFEDAPEPPHGPWHSCSGARATEGCFKWGWSVGVWRRAIPSDARLTDAEFVFVRALDGCRVGVPTYLRAYAALHERAWSVEKLEKYREIIRLCEGLQFFCAFQIHQNEPLCGCRWVPHIHPGFTKSIPGDGPHR